MNEINIENVKYTVDEEGSNNGMKSTIDGVPMYVPLDPNNRHYQAIQEWVAEGNTIQEAE